LPHLLLLLLQRLLLPLGCSSYQQERLAAAGCLCEGLTGRAVQDLLQDAAYHLRQMLLLQVLGMLHGPSWVPWVCVRVLEGHLSPPQQLLLVMLPQAVGHHSPLPLHRRLAGTLLLLPVLPWRPVLLLAAAYRCWPPHLSRQQQNDNRQQQEPF
jgi:hypothetical protein